MKIIDHIADYKNKEHTYTWLTITMHNLMHQNSKLNPSINVSNFDM